MNPNHLTRDAERLCRSLAPELGRPVYVVAMSHMGREWHGVRGALGLSGPSLDLMCRDHIDRWDGRGPMLLVNDVLLAELVSREFLRGAFLATVLHELAHALTEPWTFPDDAVIPDRLEQLVVEKFRLPEATAEADRERATGDHHSSEWVRAAVHLWHRARRVEEIPLSRLLGSNVPAFMPSAWVEALGNELDLLTCSPIGEVLAIEPPSEFVATWQTALRFARRATTTSEDGKMTIFERIANALLNRRQGPIADYAGLVRALSDGESVNPERSAEVLTQCGKTITDLERDVGVIRRRHELRVIIGKAVGIESEREKLRTAADRADRVLEAAQAKHAEVLQPLLARSDELDGIEQAATAAHEELRRLAPPEVVERRNDLVRQRADLEKRLVAIRKSNEMAIRIESLKQIAEQQKVPQRGEAPDSYKMRMIEAKEAEQLMTSNEELQRKQDREADNLREEIKKIDERIRKAEEALLEAP